MKDWKKVCRNIRTLQSKMPLYQFYVVNIIPPLKSPFLLGRGPMGSVLSGPLNSALSKEVTFDIISFDMLLLIRHGLLV
jgi:hypothetical protein